MQPKAVTNLAMGIVFPILDEAPEAVTTFLGTDYDAIMAKAAIEFKKRGRTEAAEVTDKRRSEVTTPDGIIRVIIYEF